MDELARMVEKLYIDVVERTEQFLEQDELCKDDITILNGIKTELSERLKTMDKGKRLQ